MSDEVLNTISEDKKIIFSASKNVENITIILSRIILAFGTILNNGQVELLIIYDSF